MRAPVNWFSSDWHWNHDSVIEFCDRPFATIEEMHDTILANTVKVVRPHDTLWLLGDIFFYANAATRRQVISSIPCRVILVKGNHDSGAKFSSGFAAIVTQATVLIGKQQLLLSHYPYYPTILDRLSIMFRRKKITSLDKRPKRTEHWLLHGHVHSKTAYDPRYHKQLDIGVDAWGFKPVHQDQVLSLIANMERRRVTLA